MHVLYLTNKPIFPLIDGGCVAMNQFSKVIENDNKVKCLCISTEKHPFKLSNFPKEFVETFNLETIVISTQIRPFRALLALISGKNYNLSRFKSPKIDKTVANYLENNSVDLVICESIYAATSIQTIRNYSKAKIVVRTHNVESDIWKQNALSTHFLKRFYLKSLSKSLKKEEIRLLSKVDGILTISENDKLRFQEDGIKTPIGELPVNIDIQTNLNTFQSSDFHFIGSMNWQPNIDALEELVQHIFPKIREQLPDSKLHLAGSFFPETFKSSIEKGIIVHGFVDDKNKFIQEHGIQLSPIRTGSGVRIKILESMSLGAPIVTTKLGAQGIENVSNELLIISDMQHEFIEDAVELAKNVELRRKIGTNAAQFIEKNYSIQSIRLKFSEFIKQIG